MMKARSWVGRDVFGCLYFGDFLEGKEIGKEREKEIRTQ
jgi:hypothetical protein